MQPEPVLQASVVQSLLSLQSIAVWVHPEAAEQLSVVQASLSSQFDAV